MKRKLPKVNRNLAATILEKEAAENEEKEANENKAKKLSKKKKRLSSELFTDERFAAMFENKDFEIDETSQEYLALHPMASNKQPSLVEEHFEPLTVDEDDNLSDSNGLAASESSEDDPDNDKSIVRKKSRGPRLYEVKDERHAEAFWNQASFAKEDSLPLGERVAALGENRQTSGIPNNVSLGQKDHAKSLLFLKAQ